MAHVKKLVARTTAFVVRGFSQKARSGLALSRKPYAQRPAADHRRRRTITYTWRGGTYTEHGVVVGADGSEVIASEYSAAHDTTGHAEIRKAGDSYSRRGLLPNVPASVRAERGFARRWRETPPDHTQGG